MTKTRQKKTPAEQLQALQTRHNDIQMRMRGLNAELQLVEIRLLKLQRQHPDLFNPQPA